MAHYAIIAFLCMINIIENESAVCRDFTKHKNYPLLHLKPQCGTQQIPRSPVVGGRMLNGSEINLGEFPWLVYLDIDRKLLPPRFSFWDNVGKCAGTLINNRYVLTVTTCVYTYAYQYRVKARIGEWWLANSGVDCQGERCAPPTLIIPVVKMIHHTNHRNDGSYFLNDITLLRLNQTVQFNAYVRPICLPLSCFWQLKQLECYDLTITGWGRYQVKPWIVEANIALQMRVEVQKDAYCSQVYRGDEDISAVHLESQFCAHGSPCTGDRGDPAMMEERIRGKSTYYLAGLVSYGRIQDSCYVSPALYTRVVHFLPWILEHLEP